MSFSQGWDAGFKALLIYIGIVFVWLIFIERFFSDLQLSVILMNLTAVAAGIAFFTLRRRACHAELAAAATEVAALIAGEH